MFPKITQHRECKGRKKNWNNKKKTRQVAMQPWNIRQLNINKCLTLNFFFFSFFFHILTLLQCLLHVCISIYVYNIAVIFRLKSFRSVAIPLSHFYFLFSPFTFLCLASWSVLEASLNDYMCVHAHEDFFVLLFPLTFPSCAVFFSHLILEVLVDRGFLENAFRDCLLDSYKFCWSLLVWLAILLWLDEIFALEKILRISRNLEHFQYFIKDFPTIFTTFLTNDMKV